MHAVGVPCRFCLRAIGLCRVVEFEFRELSKQSYKCRDWAIG